MARTSKQTLQEYMRTHTPQSRRRCVLCLLREKRPDIYADVLQLRVDGFSSTQINDYLAYRGLTTGNTRSIRGHFEDNHHGGDTLPPAQYKTPLDLAIESVDG